MVTADPLGRPGRTTLFHGTRPLKRWRYVAIFGEQLMACAALVRIGPVGQSFWALHVRGEGIEREHTRLLPRRGELQLSAGRLRVRDRGVVLEVELDEDEGFEVRCRNGRSEVWTRKQAGIPVRGTLSLDGAPPRGIDALAVVDDTAGYHARETEWWWSAGVGHSTDGVDVAWNLVSGVNDPPTGSERAVWVAGRPSEVAPVSFAADLSRVRCDDGSELSFAAETTRSRRDRLLLLSSDYTAPFGVFSGTLPGGVPLVHGLGVVEHHRARW